MKKNLSRIVPLLCRSLCFAVAFGAAIVSIPPARAATDIQYARGFRVESFAGCRLVSVTPQWQEDTSPFRYLLVPRGTAPPKNHPPAQVIVVPVRRVVALSTPHLGYLDVSGLVDCLVGLSSFKYVISPS
ncbi:MAG: hypothetical protein JJV98_14800, partial [Desulfosarcina sp.]|nr:hypothetical protein [Desulfobacterales bacterium]